MLKNHCLRWSVMALVCAPLIAGCVARSDLDKIEHDQLSLRQMIANDRQQMNGLQADMARLNDRMTELQHGGKVGKRESKQIASINNRLARLEAEMIAMQGAGAASGAPGAPGTPPVPGAPPTTAGATGAGMPPPSATGASATPGWREKLTQELASSANGSQPGAKTFRAGLVDMKAGKYKDAIAKFQMFRSRPKSPLAEPAEYFSANALFELGARDPANYNQAILQFNDLAMRYPKGRFAADAQLREAQAFLRTNDPLDARLTLQKLVRDYPGTPEASAADAMIKSLSSD